MSLITLAHGSGGQAMQQLIAGEIATVFAAAPERKEYALEDQACIPMATLQAAGDRLAMTTDSFVVDPIFFPGGDIGSLAVNGSVNDLAVGGAKPLYLSCALILEEGLPLADLRRVLRSMKAAADSAGVVIATGDTKVVHKGCADKMFINTCGLGVIPKGRQLSARMAQPGDVVLVNGSLGDHGAAIMAARGDLAIQSPSLHSDCRSLHGQITALLEACPRVRCMRDATRGGIAAVLNELARASGVHIQLTQSALPIAPEVQGLAELLGLDPLYLPNEGKFVAILPEAEAEAGLAALHTFAEAQEAALIGRVTAFETTPVVSCKNAFGSERIVDVPYGELLPRIC